MKLKPVKAWAVIGPQEPDKIAISKSLLIFKHKYQAWLSEEVSKEMGDIVVPVLITIIKKQKR